MYNKISINAYYLRIAYLEEENYFFICIYGKQLKVKFFVWLSIINSLKHNNNCKLQHSNYFLLAF